MRRPMGPRGVWMTVWGSWVEEVRCGRSGCLCFGGGLGQEWRGHSAVELRGEKGDSIP